MIVLLSPFYNKMGFDNPEYSQDNSYYNKELMG